MKGNLINCVTGKVSEIELSYKITGGIFNLIGGVTGYESFHLKEEYIQKIIKNGWSANIGVSNKYDGLHITAEEMEKAFIESGCVTGGKHEKSYNTYG